MIQDGSILGFWTGDIGQAGNGQMRLVFVGVLAAQQVVVPRGIENYQQPVDRLGQALVARLN
jgi:hypothetical protein